MFTLTSSAFANDAAMPRKCTADGENVSPPLEWAELLQAMQGHGLAKAQLVGTYQAGR
jgi:phosphatidylethanolamine-binding protein (PEBP) family uncharacterized protein